MPKRSHRRQPGDTILDRYMPRATEAEREAARQDLKALVAILVRIDRRLSQKPVDNPIRENRTEALDSEDVTPPQP